MEAMLTVSGKDGRLILIDGYVWRSAFSWQALIEKHTSKLSLFLKRSRMFNGQVDLFFNHEQLLQLLLLLCYT